MPPKTAKHGGARKNGGRKSKSGEFSNDKTPEEKLKSHRESRIQLLGMNNDDRQKAQKTEGILRAYNMAVAILRGDV